MRVEIPPGLFFIEVVEMKQSLEKTSNIIRVLDNWVLSKEDNEYVQIISVNKCPKIYLGGR